MSIAGGLPNAIERASAAGCEALQIFTKSSNQWRARPIPDSEIRKFRERAIATGIGPIVAHASYLINLASPTKTLWQRSVAALNEEMQRAEVLGLTGVILHPGAYTTSTEEEGLQRIAEGIADVFNRRKGETTLLLLEHTAGQGTVLGHRFEQLQIIINALDGSPRLGICLDTCHLVGAGYDIISVEGQRQVFDEFSTIINLDRLKVFHLNDSKKSLGSRLDRHEHIGKGCIGIEPFRRLLQDSRFEGLPMLLETPKESSPLPSSIEVDKMDLENLELLRTLRE